MKTKAKLITHRELARRSDATWHRILALVASGELDPAERIGNRMLFSEADIASVQRALQRAPVELGGMR